MKSETSWIVYNMEILKNLRNIGYFSLEKHGNGTENGLSVGISLNSPFPGFELRESWPLNPYARG
jgi:hypothetical protein